MLSIPGATQNLFGVIFDSFAHLQIKKEDVHQDAICGIAQRRSAAVEIPSNLVQLSLQAGSRVAGQLQGATHRQRAKRKLNVII